MAKMQKITGSRAFMQTGLVLFLVDFLGIWMGISVKTPAHGPFNMKYLLYHVMSVSFK